MPEPAFGMYPPIIQALVAERANSTLPMIAWIGDEYVSQDAKEIAANLAHMFQGLLIIDTAHAKA